MEACENRLRCVELNRIHDEIGHAIIAAERTRRKLLEITHQCKPILPKEWAELYIKLAGHHQAIQLALSFHTTPIPEDAL